MEIERINSNWSLSEYSNGVVEQTAHRGSNAANKGESRKLDETRRPASMNAPGLKRCGFLMPPIEGATLRAALEASALRGAAVTRNQPKRVSQRRCNTATLLAPKARTLASSGLTRCLLCSCHDYSRDSRARLHMPLKMEHSAPAPLSPLTLNPSPICADCPMEVQQPTQVLKDKESWRVFASWRECGSNAVLT